MSSSALPADCPASCTNCGAAERPAPTAARPPIAAAVSALGARQAYLDGELCGMFPDGLTSFSMIQAASDAGNAAGLVYFIFDLRHVDGEDIAALPLVERKARLATSCRASPRLSITAIITEA